MYSTQIALINQKLKQSLANEERFETLLELVSLLDAQSAEPEKQIALIDEALTLAQSMSDSTATMRAEMQRADWFFHYKSDFEQTLFHASNVYEHTQTIKNAELKFRATNRIVSVYAMIGNYEEAVQRFSDYLHLNDDLTPIYRATIHNNMSALYIYLEEWDKALDHSLKAIERYSTIQPHKRLDKQIISTFENMSYIYQQKGEYDKGLEAIQKAIKHAQSVNIPKQNSSLLMLARCHNLLGDHKRALALMEEAQVTPTGMAGSFWQALWHHTISEVYFALANEAQALNHLHQARETYEGIHNLNGIAQIHKVAYQFYKQKGDFEQALNYYEQLHNISEKIANDRASAHLMTLRFAYDLKKNQLAHQLEIERTALLENEIQERRQIEKALRESEERYRLLTQMMSDYATSSYINPDDTLTIEWIIGRFEQITSYTVEEFIEGKVYDRLYLGDIQHLQRDLTLTKQGTPTEGEYRIINRDGEIVWLYITRIPIWNDEEGRYTRIYSAARDVTEHRKAEENAFNLALERERIKLLSDFISQSSHDIRTPLTIISTSAELIRRIDDPQRRVAQLNKIDSQVARLNRIIAAIYMLMQINNDLNYEMRAVNINQLIKTVIDVEKSQYADRNLMLTMHLDESLPQAIGNMHYLSLAFSAIVANAILYTPDGGAIDITTSYSDNLIYFSITDTGIGIKPEDLPKIFESFYKANKARQIDGSGPGVGLTMARKIIESHKGKIRITSQHGVGTSVTIELPITTTS